MFSRQTRKDSTACAAALIAAYVLLAALPLVAVVVLRPAPGEGFLREVGKGAALVGFALLVLQVILSARFRPIDRPFGLDVVMRFHKGMAILATVLLLMHPTLLMLETGSLALLSFETSWVIDLGKLALVTILLIVLCALSFARLRVDYNVWRVLHKGVIVAIVLGFVHAIYVGSDLQSGAMKVYWWALLLVGAGVFLYRNAFVPFWGRRRFRVASVTPETHDTFTLRLEAEDGRPLPHDPGQFMFLTLRRKEAPSEQHPFTISSSPTEGGAIAATIKKSGNFTNTIDRTLPGDQARVEGPYGRFSFVHYDAPALLFIAGGVGVTPIMSMLRHLRDTGDGRQAILIYGNRTERDIIFRDELADLPDNVKIVHVLSEPDGDWDGPRGYVTRDIIEEAGGTMLADAHVYLCGPPPMMDTVVEALGDLGVEGRRIHYERFTI